MTFQCANSMDHLAKSALVCLQETSIVRELEVSVRELEVSPCEGYEGESFQETSSLLLALRLALLLALRLAYY
jgi:hypothetical protein